MSEMLEMTTATTYDRGELFDAMYSAAVRTLKAGAKLSDAAARWVTGEVLAGETRDAIATTITRNETLAAVLKSSTVAGGWGSAIERTARAFNLLADHHPELAMAHVQLGVTGAPAYRWAGQFRGKSGSGSRAAGDTFAPMAITSAMDHATRLGADKLGELVRRDAEFIGALTACGAPVLEFMQVWVATSRTDTPADPDPADPDPADPDPADPAPADPAPADPDPMDAFTATVDALKRLAEAGPDAPAKVARIGWRGVEEAYAAARVALGLD